MRLALTSLVTAVALAAAGGTALAGGDDPLSYAKSSLTENQQCVAAIGTEGHWTADFNPSSVNRFIRENCDERGKRQVEVAAGRA